LAAILFVISSIL